MRELKNAVAAVTGAASGIGRGLAISLAKEGCGLALADIDQDGLNQTAKMAKANGNKITTHNSNRKATSSTYPASTGFLHFATMVRIAPPNSPFGALRLHYARN
jgi:NADP-dependent 3-hydroxy acid dehydrogenase YdfG